MPVVVPVLVPVVVPVVVVVAAVSHTVLLAMAHTWLVGHACTRPHTIIAPILVDLLVEIKRAERCACLPCFRESDAYSLEVWACVG